MDDDDYNINNIGAISETDDSYVDTSRQAMNRAFEAQGVQAARQRKTVTVRTPPPVTVSTPIIEDTPIIQPNQNTSQTSDNALNEKHGILLVIISAALQFVWYCVQFVNSFVHKYAPQLAQSQPQWAVYDRITKQRYSWPRWFFIFGKISQMLFGLYIFYLIVSNSLLLLIPTITKVLETSPKEYYVVQTATLLEPVDALFYVNTIMRAPSIFDKLTQQNTFQQLRDQELLTADEARRTADLNDNGLSDKLEVSEMTNYAAKVAQSLDDTEKLYETALEAPPIILPADIVCTDFIQWDNYNNKLVSRKGCYDVMHLLLDLQYNPAARRHSLDNLQSISAIDERKQKRINMLKQEAEEAKRRFSLKNEGNFESHCLCSAHFGILNPWVWLGWDRHNTSLLIEPEIMPLRPGLDDAVISDSRKHMPRFGYSFKHPNLTQTDNALQQALRIGAYTQQPNAGIRLRYKTVPPPQELQNYYKQYGPTEQAFINSRILVQQDMEKYEHTSLAWLNWWANKLYKNDAHLNPSAHDLLTNKRYDTALHYAILKANASQSADAMVKAQNWLQKTFGFGGTAQQIPTTEPHLVQIQEEFVPWPHSTCVVHCIKMQQALLDARQEWYQHINKRLPVIPTTLREYGFPFLPVHTQHQQQKQQQ